MERTETNEILPPLFQLYVVGNDVDNIIGRADFLKFFRWNSHGREGNLANKVGTIKNEPS